MRKDEEAVSSVFQFAIGGAVLVLCVSFLLGATNTFGSDRSASSAAISEARASSLRQVALSSAWSWDEDGATLPQGLRSQDGGLALDALQQFKQAPWSADTDQRVAYGEAQALWGVEELDGFHMRIRPISTTGMYDLSNLSVAYVGAWSDVGDIHVQLETDHAMVAAVRAQLDLAMTAAAAQERAILASLGVDFDNKVHLTAAGPALLVDTVVPGSGKAFVCHDGDTLEISLLSVPDHVLHGDPVGVCPGDTPPGTVVSVPLLSVLGDLTLLEGDVYLDDVDYLHSAMAPRWDLYDVIIVGSNAHPEALGQGSFPAGLRDHVEDGGLLVLLGGTEDGDWLEKVCDAIMLTANQEATTPDLQHPLLSWPYTVDFDSLEKGPALPAERFPDHSWQHVLASDGLELALSPLGAYGGQGLVVATSLEPSGTNGAALATNILAYYARQDLHLDFGHSLPEGSPVAGAVATVWGTDLGANQVALRVQFLYWHD